MDEGKRDPKPGTAHTDARTGIASAYRELNVGETTIYTTTGGLQVEVRLDAFDQRSIAVQVDRTSARIPLGHFADRRLGNPPGDIPNVVEIEGLKIGADVTRAYMAGTRYSLSLIHLDRDARLYVGQAGRPRGPGRRGSRRRR